MKSLEEQQVSKVRGSTWEAKREPRPCGPDMGGSTLKHNIFSQGCFSPGFQPRRAAMQHILSFTSYITVSYTPVWHLHRLPKAKQAACQWAVSTSWILGGCILHPTCKLWGRREFSYLSSFIHRGLELLLTHTWQLFCLVLSHPKHFPVLVMKMCSVSQFLQSTL